MKLFLLTLILLLLAVSINNRHLKRKHTKKKSLKQRHKQDNLIVINDTPHPTSIPPSSIEMTKLCELKQGYLALLTSLSTTSSPQLTARITHVFTVLNTHSLSLFDQVNVKSLKISIDLRTISPVNVITDIPQMHCFQVMKSNQQGTNLHYEITQLPYIDNDQVALSLCAESEEEMKNWIYAIQEFKQCEVRLIGK